MNDPRTWFAPVVGTGSFYPRTREAWAFVAAVVIIAAVIRYVA